MRVIKVGDKVVINFINLVFLDALHIPVVCHTQEHVPAIPVEESANTFEGVFVQFKVRCDIDLAIVLSSISDIIDVQIDLMQMRTDEDLLIEPHPFRKEDFNINNPVVAEILNNGIEISDYAA